MKFTARRVATVFAVVTTLAPNARAQHNGNGYLFHEPQMRLTVRGGYSTANAGSDVFSFVTQNLTVSKSDFSGFAGGLEFAFPVSQRFELSADVGFSHAGKSSEFRTLEDNNNKPIEQATQFDRVPMTLNARYYLSSPGRSIGKLAWIPSHITPWVGAGGGMMWYSFRQNGDFVDYTNFNVFRATLKDEHLVPMTQLMAGSEFSLTPLMGFSTEARYLMAHGKRSEDFSGFNNIDLSGFSASVGLTFRL